MTFDADKQLRWQSDSWDQGDSQKSLCSVEVSSLGQKPPAAGPGLEVPGCPNWSRMGKVGTYGMASAQLYWGRMAALLLRIIYAVFPEIDWGFVFVDDFAWLLVDP